MLISLEIDGKTRAGLPVRVPDSFALREEVVMAYAASDGDPTHRLYTLAAAVSLLRLRLPHEGHGVEGIFVHGRKAYDALRSRGAARDAITEAGAEIVGELFADVFPREDEIEEAEGNSEAPEGGST